MRQVFRYQRIANVVSVHCQIAHYATVRGADKICLSTVNAANHAVRRRLPGRVPFALQG